MNTMRLGELVKNMPTGRCIQVVYHGGRPHPVFGSYESLRQLARNTHFSHYVGLLGETSFEIFRRQLKSICAVRGSPVEHRVLTWGGDVYSILSASHSLIAGVEIALIAGVDTTPHRIAEFPLPPNPRTVFVPAPAVEWAA